tara:strand:- start:3102 stop:4103 length:1002 start_codon:yes stop_codon:yes gene_type:complete
MFLLNNITRLFYTFVKQSFILPLFFVSFLLTAQQYDSVDSIVLQYSKNIRNTNALAKKIDKDFSNDLEKVRALYIYLTNTVEYNIKEYKYGDDAYSFRYSSKEELEQKIRQRDLKIINKTLSSKKAICEGYSMTFKEVCTQLDIKCVVISGYTRTNPSKIGQLPLDERHAWNAVYINSKWQFIDTTWGAGYSRDSNHWIQYYDEHYFFTNPKELITTHHPEENNWQLLTPAITKKKFVSQPLYSSLFFLKKIQLVSPKVGVLDPSKEFIILKFKNIDPTMELGYAFGNDYYLTTVIPEFYNNIATLKIPIKENKNTTLNVLSGTEVILQFKIQ